MPAFIRVVVMEMKRGQETRDAVLGVRINKIWWWAVCGCSETGRF